MKRPPIFLGFMRGVEGDPPSIIFLAETHAAFHELYGLRTTLGGELVVVVSPIPLLTCGDLYGTFPASRERSADRVARAELTYTDAISSSLRLES